MQAPPPARPVMTGRRDGLIAVLIPIIIVRGSDETMQAGCWEMLVRCWEVFTGIGACKSVVHVPRFRSHGMHSWRGVEGKGGRGRKKNGRGVSFLFLRKRESRRKHDAGISSSTMGKMRTNEQMMSAWAEVVRHRPPGCRVRSQWVFFSPLAFAANKKRKEDLMRGKERENKRRDVGRRREEMLERERGAGKALEECHSVCHSELLKEARQGVGVL